MTLVLEYQSEDFRTAMLHAEGVPWWEAPVPRRWHRCHVQTRGWERWVYCVDRCACGAIRYDDGPWFERNSRDR